MRPGPKPQADGAEKQAGTRGRRPNAGQGEGGTR